MVKSLSRGNDDRLSKTQLKTYLGPKSEHVSSIALISITNQQATIEMGTCSGRRSVDSMLPQFFLDFSRALFLEIILLLLDVIIPIQLIFYFSVCVIIQLPVSSCQHENMN